ncbi:hypothetical protein G6F31_017745 [Rhizopus arrhizus]|nr:hypothetical protein G6F31_017745 [Rhizopus arrhizus]
MVDGVRFLEQAGAQLIAIPCNTAHLWYDEIAASTGLPVLHIIQAVIDDLRRLGLPRGRIGLMGTAATLKLGLYQKHLEAQGYECIVPDDDEVERYCMGSLRAVKGNQLEAAFAPAAECIARLKARGADAVVLGCTELPLVLNDAAPLGGSDLIQAVLPQAVQAKHFDLVVRQREDALVGQRLQRLVDPLARQAGQIPQLFQRNRQGQIG